MGQTNIWAAVQDGTIFGKKAFLTHFLTHFWFQIGPLSRLLGLLAGHNKPK